MLRDIVPHHPGGILEHIREQTAAQEGSSARLEHQVVAHRDRQLSHGRDVRPECGVVGGFVVAESGVPNQLEGQVLGGVAENAAVKFPDSEDQRLEQFLKLCIGRLVRGLVGVIPFPVIVGAQVRQVVQNHLRIHLSASYVDKIVGEVSGDCASGNSIKERRAFHNHIREKLRKTETQDGLLASPLF